MANIFTQNPFILDTVWTAGTIPAGLIAATAPHMFSLIKLVNPAAAGDEVKITDINGNVIFDEFASLAHQDVVLWDAAAQGGKKFALKQAQWVLVTLTAGDKLWMWK